MEKMCNKNTSIGITYSLKKNETTTIFFLKNLSSSIGGLKHNNNNCRINVVKHIKL